MSSPSTSGNGVDAAQNKVDVILEIEDLREGWLARVDVGGIKRVLLNLLGNALKFTTSGHVKISLLRASSSTCVLEVADTGVGMSEGFLRFVALALVMIQVADALCATEAKSLLLSFKPIHSQMEQV